MRKLLSGLLVFIFIPIFLTVFLTLNLITIVFDKEIVKDSFEKTGFYNQITSSIIRDVYSSGAKIEVVDNQELIGLMNKTIPPSSVQSEFEKTIDQVYPYLLSETDNFSVTYNLVEYKKTFLKEAESLSLKKIEALPKCTKKQLEKINQEDTNKLPECKPPGFTSEEILNGVVNGDFDEILKDIPDEITVNESEIIAKPLSMESVSQQTVTETLKGIRESISHRNTLILSGFGVLLAILVLIALLRWGSYKSASRWVGWTLLLSSINLAIYSSLIAVFTVSSLQDAFGVFGETPTLLYTILGDLLNQVFYSKIVPQTIAISVLGLSLIIVPSFLKFRHKTAATHPTHKPQD